MISVVRFGVVLALLLFAGLSTPTAAPANPFSASENARQRNPDRYRLPQCYLEWALVDRRPLQQRISCRA